MPSYFVTAVTSLFIKVRQDIPLPTQAFDTSNEQTVMECPISLRVNGSVENARFLLKIPS